ncbi:MAG: hypothetical protein MR672_06305, partial [Oscillibacter sp.]|nr:hypothetical protein [Oscillibacter sp.]
GENTTNRAFLFVNLRLRPPYFRMKGAEMSMKSVTPFSFGGEYSIIKIICTAPHGAIRRIYGRIEKEQRAARPGDPGRPFVAAAR